jgi:hypothetical protein
LSIKYYRSPTNKNVVIYTKPAKGEELHNKFRAFFVFVRAFRGRRFQDFDHEMHEQSKKGTARPARFGCSTAQRERW